MHGYADDSQLYVAFRPDTHVSQDHAITSIENCVSDIRAWMSNHQLMLNDSKTELLIIGSKQQLAKVHINCISVGSTEIKPVRKVRNLGSWFDEYMSMNAHVGQVCSKGFHGLYKIKQIRNFLSEDAINTLIHAFVTSHIDYCNSLLYGLPKTQLNRLQRLLNAAARITCYVPRYAHITPVLKKLHWLPIPYRINYKIALLVFKALHNLAPSYLIELLQTKSATRYFLRSNQQVLLQVPQTKRKTFGDRSFAVAGPRVWNSLPAEIKSCSSIDTFKAKLKTHYFKLAF